MVFIEQKITIFLKELAIENNMGLGSVVEGILGQASQLQALRRGRGNYDAYVGAEGAGIELVRTNTLNGDSGYRFIFSFKAALSVPLLERYVAGREVTSLWLDFDTTNSEGNPLLPYQVIQSAEPSTMNSSTDSLLNQELLQKSPPYTSQEFISMLDRIMSRSGRDTVITHAGVEVSDGSYLEYFSKTSQHGYILIGRGVESSDYRIVESIMREDLRIDPARVTWTATTFEKGNDPMKHVLV